MTKKERIDLLERNLQVLEAELNAQKTLIVALRNRIDSIEIAHQKYGPVAPRLFSPFDVIGPGLAPNTLPSYPGIPFVITCRDGQ